MNIQWYPGHMTKAKRMMEENIKLIDLVIELLDARIPMSSRNPDIDSLANGKARLVILNKSDLADKEVTKQWIKYFEVKGLVGSDKVSFAKGTDFSAKYDDKKNLKAVYLPGEIGGFAVHLIQK